MKHFKHLALAMAMSAFLPCGAQTKGTQSNEFVINDMRFRIIAPAKVELKAFEGKGEIVIHNGPRVKHIVDGKEVEILEDESVRITFLLGNSVALKPHRFKIIRLKDHIPFIKGWSGFVFVRGRFSFFSLSTFPELEKYLNIKGDV